MLSKIGFWAFIVGLILAVVGGFVAPGNGAIVITLVILGLLIGLLNITGREIMLFLVATIALLATKTSFQSITVLSLGKYADQIFSFVANLMAPAALVASVKALWAVGRPGS